MLDRYKKSQYRGSFQGSLCLTAQPKEGYKAFIQDQWEMTFMSIMIIRIEKVVNSNTLIVQASHHGQILIVKVQHSQDKAEKIINRSVNFEMDYEEILNYTTSQDYDDFQSGLFMVGDNSIKVLGRVHNLIESGKDTIIDIYIQQGAEFISVLSSEIGNNVPNINDGIEIVVRGLTIHPVYY